MSKYPPCELCGQEIDTFSMDFDHQELFVCEDGYDVVPEDFPMVIQPKSGKTKKMYVPGRKQFKANPCGCPQTEEFFQKAVIEPMKEKEDDKQSFKKVKDELIQKLKERIEEEIEKMEKT